MKECNRSLVQSPRQNTWAKKKLATLARPTLNSSDKTK